VSQVGSKWGRFPISITLRLSEEQAGWLRQEARERDLTLNDVGRELIDSAMTGKATERC